MLGPAALIAGVGRVLPIGGPQTRATVVLATGVGVWYGRWLQMRPLHGAAIGAIAGVTLGLTAEYIGKSSRRVFGKVNAAFRRVLSFLPGANDFTRASAVLGLVGGAVAGALRGRGRNRVIDGLFGAV